MLLIACKPYRRSTPACHGVIIIATRQNGEVPSSRRIYQDPTWVTQELAGGSIGAVTKMLPTL